MSELGPNSCDVFVALPPVTANGGVIFGKNSDRPKDEVQEVIHVPAKDHADGQKVQCTYIEVDQVPHTHAVMLNKPAWTWGAEMGANEHGVCIGNVAVFTKEMGPGDSEEKLLGMDLLRLALERSTSAKEGVDTITSLLEKYGQGGRCFEEPSFSEVIYHNSYIIADGNEAYVLETAGKHWAVEKVTSGVRNISNLLSIGSNIDMMSAGLKENAVEKGYWSTDAGDFDFAKAYAKPVEGYTFPAGEEPESRFANGKEHIGKLADGNAFSISSMFSILRNEEGCICRVGRGAMATTSSQVSVLYPSSSGKPSCHWSTATPNPKRSVFKPFVFSPHAVIGNFTVSPDFGDNDPVKVKPRFQQRVDRRHPLYKVHETMKPLPGTETDPELLDLLRDMETRCLEDMECFLKDFDGSRLGEAEDLFKDVVESECKVLKYHE